jgi:hypothetical protein
LIGDLVARTAASPTASFAERNLLRASQTDFDALRGQGLLNLADVDGERSFCVKDGVSYLVVEDGPLVIGLPTDDPDAGPITLTESDYRRWRLDIKELVAKVNRANCLAGSPEALNERLWFLGRTAEEEALLLGLFPHTNAAEDQLLSLPERLPSSFSRFIVFSPAFLPSPTLARRLEALGILVRQLMLDSTFLLPLPASQVTAGSQFTHSGDYRSVSCQHHTFTLTERQAAVVRILHRAQRAGSPALHWSAIQAQLEALDFVADRMQDVFKGVQEWRLLIANVNRGFWRLNIQ